MRILANSASSIMLMVAGGSALPNTVTGWSAVYMTNSGGITALRTGGNWQSLSGFFLGDTANWCWATTCTPSGQSLWPNMYHACGRADCVHWLRDGTINMHSRNSNYAGFVRSVTLIR